MHRCNILMLPLLLLLSLISPVYGFKWPWESDSSLSTPNSSQVSELATSIAASSSSESMNPYTPFYTTCPDHDLVRNAGNISQMEAEYVVKRQEKTNKNLITFLGKQANLSDFDAEKFITDYSDSHNISIGLAFSGGGYRAMLNGAGQLLGLDDRYDESVKSGLGGLLQSSSYISGLSGGSWLVGLMVLNDWISVADIVDNNIDIWKLDDSIFNPNGINVIKTLLYYKRMGTAISSKDDAGFNTSITDIWGRALSQQFLESNDGGENMTWSGIRDLNSFKDHDMPFPIVVADGRTPGTYIIDLNSTVFEINPYELGSWDPSLASFGDVKYVGSPLNAGIVDDSNRCIVNFDNAGFIMGTSSSLFNQALLRIPGTDLNGAIKAVLRGILGTLSYQSEDIAAYSPNPFYKYGSAGIQSIVDNTTLFLVDGGEDSQNVPFYPLIQQARNVDIIFGFDNSADLDKWPNGSSIWHTYNRQFSKQGKGTPFPYVPDIEEFTDKKMHEEPVFFGCDARNLSTLIDFHQNKDINETDIPLVVLLSNNRRSYDANTSTYKMSYDQDEKMSLIRNGFEVSTSSNLTDDKNWATCVGCAIIRRSQERLGLEQSDECKKCFDKYCWSGNTASTSSSSGSGSSGSSGSDSGSSDSSSRSSTSSTSRPSSSSSSKPKNSSASTMSGGIISLVISMFSLSILFY